MLLYIKKIKLSALRHFGCCVRFALAKFPQVCSIPARHHQFWWNYRNITSHLFLSGRNRDQILTTTPLAFIKTQYQTQNKSNFAKQNQTPNLKGRKKMDSHYIWWLFVWIHWLRFFFFLVLLLLQTNERRKNGIPSTTELLTFHCCISTVYTSLHSHTYHKEINNAY